MSVSGGEVRIAVTLKALDSAPPVFYLLCQFREGWETGHCRVAAEEAWDLVKSRLPEGERCYSVFLFEADSRLQQAGLLAEVTRSFRYPVNMQIKRTFIVGLSSFSQALAMRMHALASRVARFPAPYAHASTLDEALEMMRQDAVNRQPRRSPAVKPAPGRPDPAS